MTLLRLCEPLFQYICKLNRSSRKGCVLPLEKVRDDIQRLLEGIESQAAQTPALTESYQRIHLVLIFFVDFMIQESQLSFRSEWVPLANELKELAGYEKFFDLLDQDLADPTDGATERLLVYYTCLGLGFTGVYFDQPEHIQKLMARMAVRLSRFLEADQSSRLCPQAYSCTDERDMTEPPGTKLLGIGIALIGLTVILIFTYFLARHWATGEVRKTIETINSPVSRQIHTGIRIQDSELKYSELGVSMEGNGYVI